MNSQFPKDVSEPVFFTKTMLICFRVSRLAALDPMKAADARVLHIFISLYLGGT